MRKTCMFCGDSPTTREHVWPQRLRKLVPESDRYSFHQTTSGLKGYGHQTQRESQVKRYNGSLASMWLKVVCKRCNETWMSALQTRAKPWLDPLALGEWPRLYHPACRALSAWLTMHAMVIEEIDPPFMATTPDELALFRATSEPLSNWAIWIGLHDGRPRRDFFHRGMALFGAAESRSMIGRFFADETSVPHKCDTQFTITLTGQLIGVACSSRKVPLSKDLVGGFPLCQIWPLPVGRPEEPRRVLQTSIDTLMGVMSDMVLAP